LIANGCRLIVFDIERGMIIAGSTRYKKKKAAAKCYDQYIPAAAAKKALPAINL
jgi:hypothetical protein